MSNKKLEDAIKHLAAQVPHNVLSHTDVSQIEHLTIKDLRHMVATQQPGIVNPMTEKASVVSVVIWIILADDPGSTVINPAKGGGGAAGGGP